MDDELKKFVDGAAEEVVEATKGKGKKKREKKEKVPKEPKPKRDNIAYLNNLDSISGVRKFHQVAVAKKAKSLDRPEAVARYEIEIEESKKVLDEMLADAFGSPDPVRRLLELDEEPNKVLTHYIEKNENAFKKWVEDNEFKVPKSALKDAPVEIPQGFLEELPLDLHDDLEVRYEKSDFRLRAICKKVNFMTEVEAGRIINQDGKWVKEGEAPEIEES